MTERDHDSSLDEEKPLGKRTEKKLIDFILPIRENEKFRTEHWLKASLFPCHFFSFSLWFSILLSYAACTFSHPQPLHLFTLATWFWMTTQFFRTQNHSITLYDYLSACETKTSLKSFQRVKSMSQSSFLIVFTKTQICCTPMTYWRFVTVIYNHRDYQV